MERGGAASLILSGHLLQSLTIPAVSYTHLEIDFSQWDVVLADVRWHDGAKKAFTLARQAGVMTVLDGDIKMCIRDSYKPAPRVDRNRGSPKANAVDG